MLLKIKKLPIFGYAPEINKFYLYYFSEISNDLNHENFFKKIIDEKENLFLFISKKTMKVERKFQENCDFFRVLKDGKLYWIESDYFEQA